MNKNYIKFLVIPVIILGGGTAINNCYCMQTISFNDIDTKSNKSYNNDVLIKDSEKLFSDYVRWSDYNPKITISGRAFTNYIKNIDGFFKSKEHVNLDKLIKTAWDGSSTIYFNLDWLCHVNNKATEDKYKKVLKFNLLLSSLAYIKYAQKVINYDFSDKPVEFDCWNKAYCQRQLNSVISNVQYLTKDLTKIFIPEFFVLDKPNDWISKDELHNKIYNEIKNLIESFANPIISNIGNYNFDVINKEISDCIYNGIDKFFHQENIQKIFSQKMQEFEQTTAYWNRSKFNNGMSKACKQQDRRRIKSQNAIRTIGDYVGNNKTLGQIAKYRRGSDELYHKFKQAYEINQIIKTYD